MRPLKQIAVALLAVWLMVPGARELLIDGAHWLVWGHTSQDESVEHHEGAGDEHGCSGSFHACVCHTAPHVVVADALILADAGAGAADHVVRLDAPAPSALLDGLFRPPSA